MCCKQSTNGRSRRTGKQLAFISRARKQASLHPVLLLRHIRRYRSAGSIDVDKTLLRCGFIFLQTPLANGRTGNDNNNNVGCHDSPASSELLAPELRVGTGSTVLGNNRGG